MSSGGKLGRAPCGCPGEAVFGQYYRCLKGCDAVKPPSSTADPDFSEEESTSEIRVRCIACTSDDVDLDFDVGVIVRAWMPIAPPDTRCRTCGWCWIR